MASLDEGLQALEEVHGALVNIISSDSAEMLRKAVDKQRLIWEHFHQTEKTASQLVSELMQAEERVAQKVLDAEQQKNRGLGELERLEKELWGAASRNNKLGAEKELEALKETEKEMQHLQEEIDEDTTVVIPSAVYKAQLYHNVTKIKWDHGAEPHILRGGILFKCLETPGHGARGGCKADGRLLIGQCWTLGSAGFQSGRRVSGGVWSALHSREGFCWSSSRVF
ncbi:Kinetochore protein Spc24 [Acipenser ruthenus]|uniref:Kinetochore protein Spc24 n=1 Tax=Acipenser ruthenus TaxID=7906 RepID=A0A444UVD0_ACIRT|nr:Kinetochore protein Spc24 [Acipenser ruthenus]